MCPCVVHLTTIDLPRMLVKVSLPTAEKVVGFSSVVDPVDPVAQSAFTAISVRRSIEVAKVILNVVSSLEESDQEPSEEGYLSALEEALAAS